MKDAPVMRKGMFARLSFGLGRKNARMSLAPREVAFVGVGLLSGRHVPAAKSNSRWIADAARARRCLTSLSVLVAAAALYSVALGRASLGPSEAYSALAASQPAIGAVASNVLSFDPGKPILYHLLLHWFCQLFGYSETSLRALSVFFGLASVALIFAYGAELFDFDIGLGAAALWAFNPLAIVFARWARMYSMFVALALAHLLAMEKTRRKPGIAGAMVAGALGAAMLYTHLGALLIVGAEGVILARDLWRTRRAMGWMPLAIAIALFLPFAPAGAAQTHALLFGHWLDWIGVAHEAPIVKVAVGLAAGAFALWLAFGRGSGWERSESLRRALIIAAMPPIALVAASVVIRPVFSVRYVAPSFAVLAVAAVAIADRFGSRARNLAAFGLATFFLMLSPLTFAAEQQPWREIARQISSYPVRNQTIFFETGFFSNQKLINEAESRGFPDGFFRVPFDYYFAGSNPRAAIPGSDPARSRQMIAAAVGRAKGAWLISGKSWDGAMAELPRGLGIEIDYAREFSRVGAFHVRAAPESLPQRSRFNR